VSTSNQERHFVFAFSILLHFINGNKRLKIFDDVVDVNKIIIILKNCGKLNL
jgi:hypothetical protein